MRLGAVIRRLEQESPLRVLPVGWSSPHSYRGYYECVAFERRANVTVGDCLAAARDALGSTYTGWKGGDYEMDEWTDCYLVVEEGMTGEEITPTMLDLNIAAASR